MFCSSCGTEVSPDSHFCTSCGAAAPSPMGVPVSPPPVNPPAGPVTQPLMTSPPASLGSAGAFEDRSRKKRKKWPWLIGAAFIVVAAGIASFVLSTQHVGPFSDSNGGSDEAAAMQACVALLQGGASSNPQATCNCFAPWDKNYYEKLINHSVTWAEWTQEFKKEGTILKGLGGNSGVVGGLTLGLSLTESSCPDVTLGNTGNTGNTGLT